MSDSLTDNIVVYQKNYNEKSFWKKIKKYAKIAGVGLVKKALVLFYSSVDDDTPIWVKSVIYAALGYFIFPIDGIPDIVPFLGFSDDLTAIVSAMTMIHAHIKTIHIEKADKKINEWF